MREIKFRAWDGENYHYNVVPFAWDCVISTTSHYCKESTRPPFSTEVGEAKFEVTAIMINNVKVEQFTGLKDRNGKDIYEGDIVRLTDPTGRCVSEDHEGFIETVYFRDGMWITVETETTWQDESMHRKLAEKDWEYEIIGNIHELDIKEK